MITLRYRTLVAFLAGVALTLVAGFAFRSWRADAAPGATDTTFVPLTPCRIIDTRPAFQVGPRGTPLGTAETHAVNAHGSTGNCTIPNDAVGLSLNVTAVGATDSTFLTIWATGDPRPKASSLNPAPGQPPTPNAVTTNLSGSGSFNIFNLQGSVHVLADVNGYHTHTSLHDLATDIAALQSLTAAMSLETIDGQPTVRFTGVNVQVVDGTDGTSGTNGRGNLIVGYNENDSDTRTGSHNLVIGQKHSYTSYGGLITGFNNTSHGGDVIGGGYSTAAASAVVVAGYSNRASGTSASVSGGSYNTASGSSASVSGGSSNTASGGGSSVTGGSSNTASGGGSSVTGGSSNTASGDWSSVSGGYMNEASGSYESVAGGDWIVCSVPDQTAMCGEGNISATDG